MQMQPVLMVKDFNAHGFLSVDQSFMTNADTPTLAVEGILDHPVNPYTGKAINSDEKYAHDQVILFPGNIDLIEPRDQIKLHGDNPGARWITVHDNIFDMSAWANAENPEK